KRVEGLFNKEAKPERYTRKSSNKRDIRDSRIYPDYEATKIIATRNSLWWSWRRVSSFYRETQEIHDNRDLQRLVYELKYS
ncbi:hypothetical protein ACFL60_08780, partial [Candidatus Omnitrophota bacterium]